MTPQEPVDAQHGAAAGAALPRLRDLAPEQDLVGASELVRAAMVTPELPPGARQRLRGRLRRSLSGGRRRSRWGAVLRPALVILAALMSASVGGAAVYSVIVERRVAKQASDEARWSARTGERERPTRRRHAPAVPALMERQEEAGPGAEPSPVDVAPVPAEGAPLAPPPSAPVPVEAAAPAAVTTPKSPASPAPPSPPRPEPLAAPSARSVPVAVPRSRRLLAAAAPPAAVDTPAPAPTLAPPGPLDLSPPPLPTPSVIPPAPAPRPLVAVASPPAAPPSPASPRRAIAPPPGAPRPAPAFAPPVAARPETEFLADALRRLRANGDPDAALAALDEASARFPGSTLAPEVSAVRVEALLKARRSSAALAELDRMALDRTPGHDAWLVVRGELRGEKGRWREAEADFARALAVRLAGTRDELAERALWGRANALSRLGEADRARDICALYLQRFPAGRFAESVRRLSRQLSSGASPAAAGAP